MGPVSPFAQLEAFLPYIIPLIILQLILLVVALVDFLKNNPVRGPRWLWLVLIIFFSIVGPILYFTVGRKEA
jgi:hypothetical protein